MTETRRYQVFISSTYTDLIDERQGVHAAVLRLGCIAAGMEYFPAAGEHAWDHIARVIDDSDYYVLIIGNRYGSTDENGLSFTEREFDYALSRGRPVLAFLHADPDSISVRHSSIDEDPRARLAAFRARVEDQLLVQYWKTADELALLAATSLMNEMRLRPQPGWVRGGDSPSERVPKTTSFDLASISETLSFSAGQMINDLDLRVVSQADGFEIFHRGVSGSGQTRFVSIEATSSTGSVLHPLVDMGSWKRAFIHVGRQLARGEEVTVSLRETFEVTEWEQENMHGYFVGHSIERLTLDCAFPPEIVPEEAWFRCYAGEGDHGDLVSAERVDDLDSGHIVFSVEAPPIGHTYSIEWRWSDEAIARLSQG